MSLVRVYIGIGANLDDPERQVREAIAEIRQQLAEADFSASSLYLSAPLADMQQPDYVNAVVRFATSLPAESLLDNLQQIEHRHGRVREKQRWQSRQLDLDLLLYGDSQVHSERLCIPHAQLHQRDFVLFPLQELDPDLLVPGKGNVATLLDGLQTTHIKTVIKQ